MINNFLFTSLLLLIFMSIFFLFLVKREAKDLKTVKEVVRFVFRYFLLALAVIFLAEIVFNNFGKSLFLIFEVCVGIYFLGFLMGFFQERVIYKATFNVNGTQISLIEDYGEKEIRENPLLLDTLKQQIKQIITEKKISPNIVVFLDKFTFYPLRREKLLKFYVKNQDDSNDISYFYETVFKLPLH